MDGPDSGHVVSNAACREAAGEVGDVQAHGGDVWIKEVEMVVIAELVKDCACSVWFLEVPGQKA